ELQRHAFATLLLERLHDRFGFGFFAQVGQNDIDALLRQMQRHAASEPTTGACDDCNAHWIFLVVAIQNACPALRVGRMIISLTSTSSGCEIAYTTARAMASEDSEALRSCCRDSAAALSVMSLPSSVSVTPGEIRVTRILSIS